MKYFKGHTIKLIILLFITTLLSANIYPHYDKKDFLNIEKQNGEISKNRAIDYQKNIENFTRLSKKTQLGKVNLYLNQFLSQYDEVTKKEEDYWATPKEFIANGYGDCEDYAIIKYFTLIKLGFKKDKLFFTIVYEKYSKGYHMVLSYFKDKDKSPLVLDNLSFRILPLSKRDDLKADFFLNEYGVYKMHRVNKRYELVKVKKQSSKFQKLLNKIEKEN